MKDKKAVGSQIRKSLGMRERLGSAEARVPVFDRMAEMFKREGLTPKEPRGGDRKLSMHVGDAQAVVTERSRHTADVLRAARQVSIPIGHVVAGIAAVVEAGDGDRSILPLVQTMARLATDERAKKYWIEYFGDYGKMMTREAADILKTSTITIGELMDQREMFERNWGATSSATLALDHALICQED